MSVPTPTCVPLGDQAAMLLYGDTMSPEVHRHILALAERIGETPSVAALDIVPAYTTLTVWYDPALTSYDLVERELLALAREDVGSTPRAAPREWTVPVRYDGPDLSDVAERTGLSVDDVVARHTGRVYTVFLVGFVPGFPFMGELDPALVLPRRESPRTRVPPRSVAIAGRQTGIYPLETPGGWHILGRTELRPFDLARDPPVLFRPGDLVRFEAVS